MKMQSVKDKEALRGVDPGNLLLLVYPIAIILLLLLGAVVEARGEGAGSERQVAGQAREGTLLYAAENGNMVAAPLLSQNVKMVVSGMIARVMVAQKFVNTSENWIEATYVFPLPDESMVDHMNFMVGENRIEAKIMEKKEAAKTYTKAKSEGKKSSLLVQNRPNVFTTKVANIGPGEKVVVEIEYQQRVHLDSGRFSVRFPMVVGPRYVPGAKSGADLGDTVAETTGRTVSGAASEWLELSSTSYSPGGADIPVELLIDFAPGFEPDEIISLYHGIRQTEVENGHRQIEFTGEVLADRDFVLQWTQKAGTKVVTAVFSEKRGDSQYMSLMLMPPQLQATATVPREVVFVLDVSGSMAGPSILQAKGAISLALSRLKSSDRFNIITFNNSASALFGKSKPADDMYIAQAQTFVDGLKAEGGTEMRDALILALDGSSRHELLRQVVFLTDGAVANESELFELIHARLGDSRLFTVGIGSAPNSYFMTRAASLGRGTFTYVGKNAEVKEKMTELFTKIESPVITNLRLNIDQKGADVEIYPSPLPDLYYGEPLVLAVRSGWENLQLQLTGSVAGKVWGTTVDTTTYSERKGVATFWARKKIRSLMESLALGGSKDQIRQDVVSTALEHHLMSRYTSLVAVDTRVARPPLEKDISLGVKNHLPQGWQPSMMFAGGPQTGTQSSFLIFLGCMLLLFCLIFRKTINPWRSV
ncbi:MAG: Ca-activated chloride channel family protein [Desulforhopalus sp.]|jgi:Ca-activated chloride channel family protein